MKSSSRASFESQEGREKQRELSSFLSLGLPFSSSHLGVQPLPQGQRHTAKSHKAACRGHAGDTASVSFLLSASGPALASGCRGGQREISAWEVPSLRAHKRKTRAQADLGGIQCTLACGGGRGLPSLGGSPVWLHGRITTLKSTRAWALSLRFRLNSVWASVFFFFF